MQVLEFFTKKRNQQIEQIEFTPSIQINPTSTLFLECSPNDPHTASNIVINSYPSKTNRTNLQTRIQWRRFKIASDTEHTNTQLPFITGNTYRCEPADLGYYIQAKIVSYDVACSGSAEVTIGPIRLDPNVKQLIEGALYSQSLRSQVKILEKDQTKNVDMMLTNRTIKLTDEITNKVLEMHYDMQQPKIEVNPKDPTKIFLRFEKDHENKVQKWLDLIYEHNSNFDTQSKKSFQSQGSSGSSNRIFRPTGLVNKLQIIFLTRHSRDQFIFSLRAFVCKESIKNTAALEALENVTEMRTPADAHKFFQYMSLKSQIYRLAQLAKRYEKQLNNKIRDLEEVEQTFAVATTQYAQLLEKKARQLNIDLNQSHSEIGIRREQIMGKKHFRELQAENDRLKERIRELVEQNQLKEFFSKKNNESMMLNQTNNNPFSKKNMADSYYGPHLAYQTEEPKQQSPNVAELTKSYLNLLKQNEKLKEERKMNLGGNHSMSKDLDMVNLLQSLHEADEEPAVLVKKLKNENKTLKAKIEEMGEMMKKLKQQPVAIKLNQSVAYQQQQEKKQKSVLMNEQSFLHKQEASFLSVNQSNINDSMTSEAAILRLEDKMKEISLKNSEIVAENNRLRSERDRYRTEYEKLRKGMSNSSYPMDYKSVLSNSHYFDPEGLKQENENLTNQKNSLLRKVESLTKEASKGDVLLEKKCEQLTKQNNYLRKENEGLKQKIEQIKYQNSSQEQNFETNRQSERLKKINSQLLEEIKNLKLQVERKSNPLYNSRVIELENQVNFMKKAGQGSGVEKATQDLLSQISRLQKQVQKLNRNNNDKQAKLVSQASLIERLMNSQQQNSHSVSGKDKSYSQTRNDSESNEKLKKKIKELQQEIVMMRRSTDALNRSQDMSKEMMFYNEEQMELMKRQREIMVQENQKLSKMCEKYCKDAREANKEAAKWKQQAFDLSKAQQAELMQ